MSQMCIADVDRTSQNPVAAIAFWGTRESRQSTARSRTAEAAIDKALDKIDAPAEVKAERKLKFTRMPKGVK